MQSQFDGMQVSLEELHTTTTAGQDRLDILSDLLQTREQQLLECQQRLHAHTASETALESRTQRLVAEEADLISRVASLTSEVNESQAIAAQWQEYLNKLKSELQRLENEKTTGLRELEAGQRRLLEQQDVLQALASKLRMTEDHVSDAENELVRLEAQSRELHNEVASSESRRMCVLQEIDQAQRAIGLMDQEQVRLQRALADTQQQLHLEQAALHKASSEYQQVLDKVAVAEQQANELQLVNNHHDRLRGELQQQVEQLEKAQAELTSQNDKLIGEQQACIEELSRLQADTKQSQSQLVSTDKELTQATDRLHAVMADYEKTQNSLVETDHKLTDTQDKLREMNALLVIKTQEISQSNAVLLNRVRLSRVRKRNWIRCKRIWTCYARKTLTCVAVGKSSTSRWLHKSRKWNGWCCKLGMLPKD